MSEPHVRSDRLPTGIWHDDRELHHVREAMMKRRKLASADGKAARPVMSSEELFSDRLTQEQDRFDAAMAKVPKDKFVKGIGIVKNHDLEFRCKQSNRS